MRQDVALHIFKVALLGLANALKMLVSRRKWQWRFSFISVHHALLLDLMNLVP